VGLLKNGDSLNSKRKGIRAAGGIVVTAGDWG